MARTVTLAGDRRLYLDIGGLAWRRARQGRKIWSQVGLPRVITITDAGDRADQAALSGGSEIETLMSSVCGTVRTEPGAPARRPEDPGADTADPGQALLATEFERLHAVVFRYLVHRFLDAEPAEELAAETFYKAAAEMDVQPDAQRAAAVRARLMTVRCRSKQGGRAMRVASVLSMILVLTVGGIAATESGRAFIRELLTPIGIAHATEWVAPDKSIFVHAHNARAYTDAGRQAVGDQMSAICQLRTAGAGELVGLIEGSGFSAQTLSRSTPSSTPCPMARVSRSAVGVPRAHTRTTCAQTSGGAARHWRG